MSKIFLIQNIILSFFLFPKIVYGQSVEIKMISKEINTKDVEFNFVQIDQSTAYYSSAKRKNNYQAKIYKSQYENNQWQKGKYINFGEKYSVTNLSFLRSSEIKYITLCDALSNCKIAIKTDSLKILNNDINLKNTNNTQPNIANHNNQKVLYFVSDREGGFGGMDIWLSMIDNKGNYGVPINAGKNINTQADEVTPFYNSNDSSLYFSSNKKGGLGGLDLYKSKGKLNLWMESKNITELNSEYDEMYLTFFTKEKGYFTSNRKDTSCCNDIYSFEYEQLELVKKRKNTKYFPLTLYFHNDEPDCCTKSVSTRKTYKDTYINYFQMEKEYIYLSNCEKVASFFNDSLKGNYNKLNIMLDHILKELNLGNKIELHIKGYSSPLHEKEYNINLSKRRIMSLKNYIIEYKKGVFIKFLNSEKIIIKELPFGEEKASRNVSSDPKNKSLSIYSIEAMLERKIEIIDVISQ